MNLVDHYKKELEGSKDVYRASYIKGCYYKYALSDLISSIELEKNIAECASNSTATTVYSGVLTRLKSILSIEDTPYMNEDTSNFIPGED